jgi:FkbM family methyltransferase
MSFERTKSLARIVIPREVRNWMRSPKKSAEWLWDDTLFNLGVKKTLRLPNGRSLVCHPRVLKIAYRDQICDPGQAAEFQQFLSMCQPEMLLFDIGASFGIFSLAAANLGGRAIAVEPSPIAVRMISAQVKLNGLDGLVHVVPGAAGASEGSIRMLSSGVFSDGYFRVVEGRHKNETSRVDLTTIDALSERFGIPSHIKIDVEGFEGAVLRGAGKLLNRSSPMIFLEIHNEMVATSGGDPKFTLDELLRLDYRIFSTDGAPISKEEALRRPITRIFASRERQN